MKVAMACRADEVSVRLCFLVNVRKASGRKVAGGKLIGSTDGVAASEGCFRWTGWTGVPNAEEEGTGSFPLFGRVRVDWFAVTAAIE